MPSLSGSQKAKMVAMFGRLRFGAARFGYTSGRPFITVDGTQRAVAGAGVGILEASLTITDAEGEAPSTCTFTAIGFVPVVGQEIVIVYGSTRATVRRFAGHLLQVTMRQAYANAPAFYDCSAIDYTWLLSAQLVTERYTNLSASAIAADLVERVAGISSAGLAPDLPVLDEITFTEEPVGTALTRLFTRIGGYWYLDYARVLHGWIGTEALALSGTAPVAITSAHPSLADFSAEDDLSSVVTQIYVEGRGSRVAAPVPVGETMIPVDAVDMFEKDPGIVEILKASFQGASGSGAQYLTYTDRVVGGIGSLIGPGVSPSAPPSAAALTGSGITFGDHRYKYTHVTAGGETLPSPASAAFTAGALIAPTAAPIVTAYDDGNGYSIGAAALGDSIELAYSYSVDLAGAYGYDTDIGPASTPFGLTVHPTYGAPLCLNLQVQGAWSTDPRIKTVHLWANVNGGGWIRCVGSSFSNHPAGGTFTWTHLFNGAWSGAMGAPNANAAQATITGIAIGPSGVTSRKLYRTEAGLTVYKLVATIANNTATSYTDSTADGSLGAAAPSSDTSGLSVPAGVVNPGSTTVPVASTGPFSSGGGWAIVGEQFLRYTGLSGSTLTGIPTAGPGSIQAAIAFNATVMGPSMLTGVPASGPGSIRTALTPGDELYLVVVRIDYDAQAALAARLTTGSRPDDGVRVRWMQDRRLSVTEAAARGDAVLALSARVDVRIRYRCRDWHSTAGQTIAVSIGAITGSYKIQSAHVGAFSALGHPPTYTVEASSRRFSFEDLVKRLGGSIEG